MNFTWKDIAVIAGVVLVMVIIGSAVYNTGSKMLAKKSNTSPPKA